jgi:hypothetical protein
LVTAGGLALPGQGSTSTTGLVHIENKDWPVRRGITHMAAWG